LLLFALRDFALKGRNLGIKRTVLLLAAMVFAILSLGVTFFAAQTTATAETTNVTSIADSSILQNSPTTNYGATTLGADGDEPSGSGKDKYGLLRWDLASMAPGTKISSASVTLTVTNSSTQTYQAYALKRGWAEPEVTWNSYAVGKPWEVAGAKGSLDREATVAGTITPSATGERTFTLSAAVVQRWVDNPTTNQGIIIANATNTDGFGFYSRESSTSSQRPRLTLNVEGVDNTAPETNIDSGPSAIFSNPSASFAFSSNEVNSTFDCRLDGGAFSSCTSPKSYTDLSEGSHTFEVRATDAAGNIDPTPASRTWTVDTSSTQGDPILVGTGDIASCANQNDEATAKLLDGISGTVFAAGDTAYDSGTAAEFNNCYDPTWGRHKARTYPVPGNHEYRTANASGYFGYYGAVAGDPSGGYYSYNLGQWHIVALNSMCDQVGGCTESSPMVTWLKQDLAANPKTCTIAYFHHPLFSSGEHGNQPFMKPTWDALYAADADVVVSGHDHNYERFAPQDPSGAADQARGIREFVVGNGGRELRPFGTIKANSEVRNSTTYGVLKLTLHPTSYDWQFVPVAGQSFTDSGSDQCHGAPGDTDSVAPTVSDVMPTEGATDVAVTANAEATFSEDMDSSTISTTTFTLVKQGATSQPLTVQVSYDSATNKATLDPNVDLEAGTTYLATLKGGATGVKDLRGNPLAEDKTWSFSTAAAPLPQPDITPPETNIDSGPSVTVSDTGSLASFAFSSNEANSTFECSLDGDAFALCTSPKSYVNLSEDSHTFEVRAIDAAGNTDLSPASRTWTMDTTPPNIANVPSDITKEATSYAGAPVIFTIPTANDAFDGNRTVSCSPDSGSIFPLGLTEVTCSASDASGNTSSAKFNVTVLDTTAPNMATHADITGVEAAGPDGATVTYTKPTATDSVDTSVMVDCSPASGTKFALGDTTVTCTATDNSGNKATSTFKVTVVPPPPQDTTPPNTIIDSGPSGTIKQNSATFTFSSSEGSSTFQCKLDSAAFSACSTPKKYTGLANGSHTFSVRATDAARNTDATPAIRSWTVRR
jgi:hypothetical protein